MKKTIKLFCLPHAGGSAMLYKKWEKYLVDFIELCPLELPGRGKKIAMLNFTDMNDCVEYLFKIIEKQIDKSEYAFFGHSMGTIIVYELMKKIYETKYKKPRHIFMSGRFPPNKKISSKIHMLDDYMFKKEIIKMGGIPKEIIQNEECFDIFIPTLKADFKMVENYKFSAMQKWNTDLSVFFGKRDSAFNKYNIEEWEKYTNKKCDFYEFDGGHMFVFENADKVVQKINEIMFRSVS